MPIGQSGSEILPGKETGHPLFVPPGTPFKWRKHLKLKNAPPLQVKPWYERMSTPNLNPFIRNLQIFKLLTS